MWRKIIVERLLSNKLAIIAFFVGIIFGNGALWSFMQIQSQNTEYLLHVINMENELSKELMDIESELLQNAEEIIKIGDTLEKNHDRILFAKLAHLKMKHDSLKGRYTEVEKRLANLEN
jgi:DUF1009 family protein